MDTRKYRFTLLGVFIALSFWILDAIEHWLIYGEAELEFIPANQDELWLRLIACVLFAAFGYYLDAVVRRMSRNAEENQRRIFKATVIGVHHMLFGLINDLVSLKEKARNAGIINDDDMHEFEQEIRKATSQLNKLEQLTDISEDKIRDIILRESGISGHADVNPKAVDPNTLAQ